MENKLTAMEKVLIARDIKRPRIDQYINNIFTDFFEQKGDCLYSDDKSIMGGIALFNGIPVTVIGQHKGTDLKENVELNFGMPQPEGYRKALRLMQQAEKFGRPVITFIDTPGAYPGIEAEEHGQSRAIAINLAKMSSLKVPVIAIVTGEGSSGGALALGVANTVLMLEHAVYSVLSPEGFASIVWKDAGRNKEASELMKLTAQDLLHFGVIDGIIPEPDGGAHENSKAVFDAIGAAIEKQLDYYKGFTGDEVAAMRFQKFRYIDKVYLLSEDRKTYDNNR